MMPRPLLRKRALGWSLWSSFAQQDGGWARGAATRWNSSIAAASASSGAPPDGSQQAGQAPRPAEAVLQEIRSMKHPNPELDRLIKTFLSDLDRRPVPVLRSSGAGVPHTIFVNNPLKMSYIDVIGMDYDYTLVSYTQEMEALIYDLAKAYLTEQCGYPPEINRRQYDPSFAVRGLAVDVDKGLLCKLSYIHQIAKRSVFRGRRPLSPEQTVKEYGGSIHVSPDYRNQQMKPLVDLFSLATACLVADVLDYLLTNEILHDSRAVVEDVLTAINHVHTSGAMHSTVLTDPSKFLLPAPHLRVTLQRFADAGKKLFLCSNSGWSYVDGGLRYLLGNDWRDMFDVVIVGAGKPSFYTSDRPFRQISPVTGKIQWTQVRSLERGKVYTQGSLHALTGLTGWKGPRVLYMGDSLWADLVDARRLQGWRTGAVIRELEGELSVQQSQAYRQRAGRVIAITELLRLVQEEMERQRYKQNVGDAKIGVRKVGPTCDYLPSLERQYAYASEDLYTLRLLEKYNKLLNAEMSAMFNHNFGSVFRAEGEPTLFAFSLRRYVDLYTSRVENLRFYSPNHRFFPERGISMPHDPRLSSMGVSPPPNDGVVLGSGGGTQA